MFQWKLSVLYFWFWLLLRSHWIQTQCLIPLWPGASLPGVGWDRSGPDVVSQMMSSWPQRCHSTPNVGELKSIHCYLDLDTAGGAHTQVITAGRTHTRQSPIRGHIFIRELPRACERRYSNDPKWTYRWGPWAPTGGPSHELRTTQNYS